MAFRNEMPNPRITLIKAEKATVEWRIRYNLTQSIQLPNPNISTTSQKKTYWVAWKKPQGGFIKINFDGSKSSEGAAGGFIIRGWIGKFIQASSFNLRRSSILVAEVIVMCNGIKTVVQAGFAHIHIEGDNKTLIQAV